MKMSFSEDSGKWLYQIVQHLVPHCELRSPQWLLRDSSVNFHNELSKVHIHQHHSALNSRASLNDHCISHFPIGKCNLMEKRTVNAASLSSLKPNDDDSGTQYELLWPHGEVVDLSGYPHVLVCLILNIFSRQAYVHGSWSPIYDNRLQTARSPWVLSDSSCSVCDSRFTSFHAERCSCLKYSDCSLPLAKA